MLCVCVYHTEHGEEKEEHRIVWGFENQNCRKALTILSIQSIFRDLNAHVSSVCQEVAHGTVPELPGCGQMRNIYESLQWRIVQIVDKEPWSTSKQIQADLQAQSTTLLTCTIHRHLNEKWRYDRRPRRSLLLTQTHKKLDWSLPNLPEEAKILMGEGTVDKWD